MKKWFVFLLLLSVCAVCRAADFTTINDESISVYLKLLPEYMKIAQAYGDTDVLAGADAFNIAEKPQIMSELENLLASYNISLEEFANLSKKVSMGFAAAQMEAAGMNPQAMGFSQAGELSDDEKAVIQNHLTDLEEVFNK